MSATLNRRAALGALAGAATALVAIPMAARAASTILLSSPDFEPDPDVFRLILLWRDLPPEKQELLCVLAECLIEKEHAS